MFILNYDLISQQGFLFIYLFSRISTGLFKWKGIWCSARVFLLSFSLLSRKITYAMCTRYGHLKVIENDDKGISN